MSEKFDENKWRFLVTEWKAMKGGEGQCIAELEGKIDQLTAHSDIERQDDK